MKNDPFEIHEIDHLSPSSVNTFIDDTCLWIMRYLFGYRHGGSPAMWRGTVSDHGVGNLFGLNDADKIYTKAEAIKEAEAEYIRLHNYCMREYPDQIINKDKYTKEKRDLPKYLNAAFDFYLKLGKPSDYQKEVNLYVDDIPVPIQGYIDLQYEDIIRDIKTAGRMPNKVSDAHARQVSVYAKAEDCMPMLDYISPTGEVKTLPVMDVDGRIEEVRKIALAIMNLLSISNDKNEIANMFYPNFDDWKWGEDEIKFAKTIWSIK